MRKVRRKCFFPTVVCEPQSQPCKKCVHCIEGRQCVRYRLEKYHYVYVPSSLPCWRLILFFARWFIWSQNTTLWLFRMCFKGQFSFRVLLTCKPYPRHVKINQYTGEISPDKGRTIIYPVCAIFSNVMAGIRKSRQAFEEAPDTGIFSKSSGRICNLISNYVFRFFFVGVILTLICMPVLCVVVSTLSFALALLSFFYMPAVIILIWVYQWLFYDFENKRDDDWGWQLPGTVAPLFMVAFHAVVRCVLQIAWALTLLVLHFVLALFFVVWGPIRYCLRTLYDSLMFCMLKCSARIPSIDTQFSKKISGPGIGRQFFYSISENSLLALFKQELEKIALNKFKEVMKNIIYEPETKSTEIMLKIAKSMGFAVGAQQFDNSGNKKLYEILDRQVQKRIGDLRWYDYNISHVRFSQEELDTYMPLTENIVKELMEKYQLQSLWKDFSIEAGSYAEMNCHLWKKFFQCEDVLDPIENFEKEIRMKIKESRIQQIANVMKGEVDLNKGAEVQMVKQNERARFAHNFSPKFLHLHELRCYIVPAVISICHQNFESFRSDTKDEFSNFFINLCIWKNEERA